MAATGPKKQNHTLRNVVMVGFFVLLGVGAVVATPPIVFVNVTVTGTAHAGPAGSVPTGVTFVDENGVPYTALVGSGGVYSLSLMNGHTFTVFIEYSAPGGGPEGKCSAGSLALNTLGFSQTFDVSC